MNLRRSSPTTVSVSFDEPTTLQHVDTLYSVFAQAHGKKGYSFAFFMIIFVVILFFDIIIIMIMLMNRYYDCHFIYLFYFISFVIILCTDVPSASNISSSLSESDVAFPSNFKRRHEHDDITHRHQITYAYHT